MYHIQTPFLDSFSEIQTIFSVLHHKKRIVKIWCSVMRLENTQHDLRKIETLHSGILILMKCNKARIIKGSCGCNQDLGGSVFETPASLDSLSNLYQQLHLQRRFKDRESRLNRYLRQLVAITRWPIAAGSQWRHHEMVFFLKRTSKYALDVFWYYHRIHFVKSCY